MDDLIFVDKPPGISTHSPVEGDPSFGFAEHIEARLGEKLWVCHRLDKDTFGALALAKSKQAAAKLSAAFEATEIKKTYIFLSNRKARSEQFTVKSYIAKQRGEFVSFEPRPGQEENALTEFKLLRSVEGFTVWEAKPKTGKPHQIRLHAEQSGIPILGDKEHGGAPFTSLMLQSVSLESENISHSTPLSRLFADPGLCYKKELAAWILAIEKRERYMRSLGSTFGDTVRLLHTEGGRLRIEKLGDVISLQWFADEGDDLSGDAREDVMQLIKIMNWDKWRLQIRWDRGKSPNTNPEEASTPPPPEAWVASEGLTKYEFRRDTSLSTGLFLDQRANRRWIKAQSPDKKVLNLFCYTGGFSVVAAQGGAEQTTSVDISKNFLEWTKRNFELNDIDASKHMFHAMDAREYLKYADKKKLLFDLIICDPPSFGRTKDSVFKIDKDLPHLLFSLTKVLAPKGQILLSTNYEQWTNDSFMKLNKNINREKSFGLTVGAAPTPDLDFEMPGEPTILKSVVLSRST